MQDDIRQKWASLGIKGRVLFEEPLAGYTSWGIGGPAQVLVFPQGLDDLKKIYQFATQEKIPWLVLGSGTNILVKDEGVAGIVINLSHGFNKIYTKGNYILAQAGAPLSKVIKAAYEKGLGGLEALAGIPGTLGGAIYMNAGTTCGDMAQVVEEIKILDQGGIRSLSKLEIGFGYRHTSLPEGSIILEAKLALTPRPKAQIKAQQEHMLAQRKMTQPQGVQSAGCVFKNPAGFVAGQLIEEVGLAGKRIGDAQVSPQHANFIINQGRATAAQVLQLMQLICEQVWAHKGIRLEPEVQIVGS